MDRLDGAGAGSYDQRFVDAVRGPALDRRSEHRHDAGRRIERDQARTTCTWNRATARTPKVACVFR
jgi:hypothetical protein